MHRLSCILTLAFLSMSGILPAFATEWVPTIEFQSETELDENFALTSFSEGSLQYRSGWDEGIGRGGFVETEGLRVNFLYDSESSAGAELFDDFTVTVDQRGGASGAFIVRADRPADRSIRVMFTNQSRLRIWAGSAVFSSETGTLLADHTESSGIPPDAWRHLRLDVRNVFTDGEDETVELRFRAFASQTRFHDPDFEYTFVLPAAVAAPYLEAGEVGARVVSAGTALDNFAVYTHGDAPLVRRHPEILNVRPAKNASINAAEGLSFEAVSTEAISQSNIRLLLGGVDVSAELQHDGDGFHRIIHYDGLEPGRTYPAEIEAFNSGGTTSAFFTFETEPPSPRPHLFDLGHDQNGFGFSFDSIPGREYIVQSSRDLTSWDAFETLSEVAGEVRFSHQTDEARRFYRVSPRSTLPPLTLEPGVTTRGEVPETWTVDLRASGREALEAVATGVSSRIYGAAEGDLHSPLAFRTDFERETQFGFLVTRAAQNGAVLDVYVDGEFYHRKSWPSAGQTHVVDTVFYLPVPAGERTISLQIADQQGVVVFGAFQWVDSAEEFLAPYSRELLEPMERPTVGTHDDGYRGIWFTLGQFSEYGDKYSGGLGTYTANHRPLAIYSEEVDKTFFVYGGTVRDQRHLLIMASYYDHQSHQVPRPTIVHDKEGVNDPHDNPSIAMDGDGHIWVFISGRGRHRPGFKYRSAEPYKVDKFELIAEQEMTYPQPWWIEGRGFIHLLTKYTAGRELYFETSPDGMEWTEDRKIAGIRGHYQVSAKHNDTIGTFFNRHPGGSVDRRTDLYYLQTADFGETWTWPGGAPIDLPLVAEDNAARVIDYESQGRLQYTIDLNFDRDGNPLLLYLTSAGYQPGPANEPREWTLTRWDGQEWVTRVVTGSGHNYDLGSLYVHDDFWRIVGPTGVGPQPWGTGGEVEMWVSYDQGETWAKERQVTSNSARNHTFVRRPENARDPFYAFWADGNTDELSISKLYFGDSTGRYWELPYDMEGDFAEPREILAE